MSQSEKTIEEAIKALVKSSPGSWALKLHGSSVTGAGVPDLIGSYRGLPFLVEVKAPGGTVSQGQQLWVRRLEDTGYVSGVVYSVDDFTKLFDHV